MSMEELFGDYADLARHRQKEAMKQNHYLPRQKTDSVEDALQTSIENAIDDYLLVAGCDYEVALRRAWKVLEKQTLSVRRALYEQGMSKPRADELMPERRTATEIAMEDQRQHWVRFIQQKTRIEMTLHFQRWLLEKRRIEEELEDDSRYSLQDRQSLLDEAWKNWLKSIV